MNIDGCRKCHTFACKCEPKPAQPEVPAAIPLTVADFEAAAGALDADPPEVPAPCPECARLKHTADVCAIHFPRKELQAPLQAPNEVFAIVDRETGALRPGAFPDFATASFWSLPREHVVRYVRAREGGR